jgi:uncharacterized Rmd1/YagE family protein
MAEPVSASKSCISVKAQLVGERIDIRTLEKPDRLAVGPLVMRVDETGTAAVMRYGAVVLFDVGPTQEATLLETLKPLVVEPYADSESERARVAIRTDIDAPLDADGVICVPTLTVERIQVIATVLARSVVLAFYERRLAQVFDRIEPLATQMQRTGRTGAPGRELLSHIGDVLLMQHKMVGRVEVTEKPDLLWDHPELERLYIRLQDEYEVVERARALDRKLALISQTAATSLELLQNNRMLRVEWYIVALIVIEILLSLYDIFWLT